MGPLLFAGLATFGATVAIGIIAAGTPRPSGAAVPMPPSRRMAVILFALASGGGLWGVFVALLAAASGSKGGGASARDVAGAPLVAVLPIVGAVVALVLMMRAFSRVDPWILGRSIRFIVPEVVLAIVAAILTVVLDGPAAEMEAGPFLLLGFVSTGAAIWLGVLGVGSVQALAVLDGSAPDDAVVRAEIDRVFKRCVPFVIASIASAALAILLVSSRL